MHFWGAMFFYALLGGIAHGWALDTLLYGYDLGEPGIECWLIADIAMIIVTMFIVLPQAIELIVATYKEPGQRRLDRYRTRVERLRDKARWDAAAQHHLAVSRQKFVDSLFN